jgi:hypothetical protein
MDYILAQVLRRHRTLCSYTRKVAEEANIFDRRQKGILPSAVAGSQRRTVFELENFAPNGRSRFVCREGSRRAAASLVAACRLSA